MGIVLVSPSGRALGLGIDPHVTKIEVFERPAAAPGPLLAKAHRRPPGNSPPVENTGTDVRR